MPVLYGRRTPNQGRGRKRVLRAGASREMVSLPIQTYTISSDTGIHNFPDTDMHNFSL